MKRMLGFGAIGVFAVLLMLGMDDGNVDRLLRANAFELVNAEGKVVGRLAADRTGTQLELLNTEGAGFRLSALDDGSISVGMLDNQRTARCVLNVAGSDMASFFLFGRGKGHSSIEYGLNAAGLPYLKMKDEKGRERVMIGPASEDGFELQVLDKRGRVLSRVPE
ncbi:MAG: hypothetical protein AB1716_10120 [Planctomycetota bacterium]